MNGAVAKRKAPSRLAEPRRVANLGNLTVEYGALQERTPKTHARPYPRNTLPRPVGARSRLPKLHLYHRQMQLKGSTHSSSI